MRQSAYQLIIVHWLQCNIVRMHMHTHHSRPQSYVLTIPVGSNVFCNFACRLRSRRRFAWLRVLGGCILQYSFIHAFASSHRFLIIIRTVHHHHRIIMGCRARCAGCVAVCKSSQVKSPHHSISIRASMQCIMIGGRPSFSGLWMCDPSAVAFLQLLLSLFSAPRAGAGWIVSVSSITRTRLLQFTSTGSYNGCHCQVIAVGCRVGGCRVSGVGSW
jgi:hypothetical protein